MREFEVAKSSFNSLVPRILFYMVLEWNFD